jgi:hypothetical protein
MTYGFIITRHVNSEKTNKYWNHSVKLIRRFYPNKQIVIIDDNSNPEYLKSEHEYENLTIIQSEYPARGELLPFIYFLKYKWFDNAIIIHDSVFIHKRIPFEIFKCPVLPLWHHPQDTENVNNLMRLTGSLKNNNKLYSKIFNREPTVLGLNNNNKYNICFGCQCFINLHFLERIERKYRITNLVNAVHCRTDRCTLERLTGLIFSEEYPQLSTIKSLFGRIVDHHKSFGYHFDEYLNDFKRGKICHSFTKTWTGR